MRSGLATLNGGRTRHFVWHMALFLVPLLAGCSPARSQSNRAARDVFTVLDRELRCLVVAGNSFDSGSPAKLAIEGHFTEKEAVQARGVSVQWKSVHTIHLAPLETRNSQRLPALRQRHVFRLIQEYVRKTGRPLELLVVHSHGAGAYTGRNAWWKEVVTRERSWFRRHNRALRNLFAPGAIVIFTGCKGAGDAMSRRAIGLLMPGGGYVIGGNAERKLHKKVLNRAELDAWTRETGGTVKYLRIPGTSKQVRLTKDRPAARIHYRSDFVAKGAKWSIYDVSKRKVIRHSDHHGVEELRASVF